MRWLCLVMIASAFMPVVCGASEVPPRPFRLPLEMMDFNTDGCSPWAGDVAADEPSNALSLPGLLFTRQGDRLRGRAVEADAHSLRFSAQSAFSGELRVQTADVLALRLEPGRAAARTPWLVLTDGAALPCRPVRLDAKEIVFEDPSGVERRLALTSVACLQFERDTMIYPDPSAGLGAAWPWGLRAADSWVKDGRLVVIPSAESPAALCRRVEPGAAFTLLLEFAALPGTWSEGGVILAGSGPDGNDGIVITFPDFGTSGVNAAGARWEMSPGGAMRWLDSRGGVLRLSLDPANSRLQAWLNEREAPLSALPKMRFGGFVAVIAQSSMRIETLRLLPGVVPPGRDEYVPALPRIRLRNGDEIIPRAMAFSQDAFTVEGDAGLMQVPTERVKEAVFRLPVTPAPPRPGEVIVWLDDGWLILENWRLTEKIVSGRLRAGGQVGLDRAAVRWILFPARAGEGGKP